MQSKEKEQQVKNLLIVDDEEAFLKLLGRIFSKHFNVQTAVSGDAGLAILNSGFKPGVILSDQRMPGMSGDEFLEKSMSIVPDASRIILTGYTNTKDIIACINRGHAFMYLTKPSEELELIQAVRIGFDHYFAISKNKQYVEQLNESVKELKNKHEKANSLLTENRALLSQSVQAMAGLFSMSERFYFNQHSQNVAIIAKAIASEMGLDTDTINTIVLSSLLHDCLLVGMPLKFHVIDPIDMENVERDKYFEYFNKSVQNLARVKLLAKHAKIISQIWEHNDGSGYPMKLSGNGICIEAHIIAIANIYHNRTYRLPQDLYEKFMASGEITQSPEETKTRHNEAIKFFYRKANWYNMEITTAFHDIIKKKYCSALNPDNNPLVLRSIELTGKPPELPIQMTSESNDEEQSFSGEADITKQKKQKQIDKEINISDIQVGMLVAHNVVTNNGILIVRQDTMLDSSTTRNIRHLVSNGMISGKIWITVNVEE